MGLQHMNHILLYLHYIFIYMNSVFRLDKLDNIFSGKQWRMQVNFFSRVLFRKTVLVQLYN